MIGSLDQPDLISSAHIALVDYSQVWPGSQRLGKAAGKYLIVHPKAKPPARYRRFGNLKHSGPDLPALSDERIVHLDPFRREVFAELAVLERSADLLFPPPYIFDGVCVDRFIGSPMCLAIRLIVSGKVYASAAIRPTAGDFQIALLAGRPRYSNSCTVPTLTESTFPAVVESVKKSGG